MGLVHLLVFFVLVEFLGFFFLILVVCLICLELLRCVSWLSLVIIFSISIRFFNSLISLFSSYRFGFVSSFSSFLFFFLHIHNWVLMFVLFFWPWGMRYFLYSISFFHISHSREYAGCSVQLKGFWHSNSEWFDFPNFVHIGGLVHLSLECPHFWHLRGFGTCFVSTILVSLRMEILLTSVTPCGLRCSLISSRGYNVRSEVFYIFFREVYG